MHLVIDELQAVNRKVVACTAERRMWRYQGLWTRRTNETDVGGPWVKTGDGKSVHSALEAGPQGRNHKARTSHLKACLRPQFSLTTRLTTPTSSCSKSRWSRPLKRMSRVKVEVALARWKEPKCWVRLQTETGWAATSSETASWLRETKARWRDSKPRENSLTTFGISTIEEYRSDRPAEEGNGTFKNIQRFRSPIRQNKTVVIGTSKAKRKPPFTNCWTANWIAEEVTNVADRTPNVG